LLPSCRRRVKLVPLSSVDGEQFLIDIGGEETAAGFRELHEPLEFSLVLVLYPVGDALGLLLGQKQLTSAGEGFAVSRGNLGRALAVAESLLEFVPGLFGLFPRASFRGLLDLLCAVPPPELLPTIAPFPLRIVAIFAAVRVLDEDGYGWTWITESSPYAGFDVARN